MNEDKPQRTIRQNSAMHTYFRLLAEKLNEHGLNIHKVLNQSVEIDWTSILIKELLWRQVQEFCLGKKSTTKLTTEEVTEIYENLNRHLSTKFPDMENVPFPSDEVDLMDNYPTENNSPENIPF